MKDVCHIYEYSVGAMILCKRQSLKETKCGKFKVNVQFNNGGAVTCTTQPHSRAYGPWVRAQFYSIHFVPIQFESYPVIRWIFFLRLHNFTTICCTIKIFIVPHTTYDREKIRMVAVFLILFCYFFILEHICSVVCTHTRTWKCLN